MRTETADLPQSIALAINRSTSHFAGRDQRELGRRASERKYSSICVRNPAGTSSEPESDSGWLSPSAFLPQIELEVLDLLERVGLQRREVARIGEHLIVVELLQVAHDLHRARAGRRRPASARGAAPARRPATRAARAGTDGCRQARSASCRPYPVAVPSRRPSPPYAPP